MKREFKANNSRIWLENENKEEIAFVSFPQTGAGTVDIRSTVVSSSLQGQGIASELMESLADGLRKSGRKASLTCSYAVNWFEKHPEYKDVLI